MTVNNYAEQFYGRRVVEFRTGEKVKPADAVGWTQPVGSLPTSPVSKLGLTCADKAPARTSSAASRHMRSIVADSAAVEKQLDTRRAASGETALVTYRSGTARLTS